MNSKLQDEYSKLDELITSSERKAQHDYADDLAQLRNVWMEELQLFEVIGYHERGASGYQDHS